MGFTPSQIPSWLKRKLSAWKENSANFALTEFHEVVRKLGPTRPKRSWSDRTGDVHLSY